ncbi:MAG: type IV pilus assembly protein FimV [Gammaproteobacteria bacterium]
MVRKLSWLVALLALWCSGAFALGLGDINLHSGLNQPMSADIDLVSVRSDEADSIKVSLGSADDFAQAGLDRPYLLNQLRFLVVASRKGHYRIHVSTEQAVREPFLDFLIQVTWKGGQLQREYTVLLDPPVLLPAPVQRITPPVTKSVTPRPPVATTPAAAPTPIAPPMVPAPSANVAPAPSAAPTVAATPDTYGPVRRSDTLWGIANRLRPDSSVTTEQMMQALLRANPSAFINNNVNNLKAGRILRVPPAADIAAIDPQQARRDTHMQNDAWRTQRATAAPPPAKSVTPPAVQTAPAKSAPVAITTPAPVATPAPAPSQAQLKVLAPQSEDAAKAKVAPAGAGTTPAPAANPTSNPAAASAAGATGGDVHKELALANEAVETQRQETEDLRTRLTDLERQIATMQKLMAVKNEQLSSMQAKTANSATKSPENATTNNPATLVMIGIVAVILAALLWIALRRRQSDAAPFAISAPLGNGGPMATSVPGATAGAAAMGGASVAALRTAPVAPAVVVPTPPLPERATESDPLAEADIYLAYGRYQQAEDLIKEAMHHDRNPELRVKLLEIYFAAKNSTGFEDAARDLRHEVGPDSPYWQRILPMGRELCPYSLLFNADETAEHWDDSAPHSASAETHSAPIIPDSYDFDESDDAFMPAADQGHLDLEAAHDGADALDEIGTKLDLARAYIDMGDPEGARNILDEVMQEGDARQQDEARALLMRIGH